MGEQKVLNNSLHPAVDPDDFDLEDFDPAKQPKNLQRWHMMLPISIRCNTCGNYNFRGISIYAHVEDVEGEAIFRYYFRCSKCSAELTMKCDPQKNDYTMEAGASITDFEPPQMRRQMRQ